MNDQLLNIALVVLVAAGLWFLLSTSEADVFVNPLTLEQDRVALSIQEQIEQGRSLAPQFEAKLGGVDVGSDQARLVVRVGHGLLDALARQERLLSAPKPARWTVHPFRFQVLNSDIVNAFALPDGSVYITRGLLQRLTGEDDVVAVLAHEIGHVVLRHTARAFESEAKGNIVLWVLGNLVGDDLTNDLAGAANVLFQLNFSREHESQADAFGFVLSCAAGYDSDGFRRVFELFKNMDQDSTPEFLRTHPLAGRRIEQLQGLGCRFPIGVLP